MGLWKPIAGCEFIFILANIGAGPGGRIELAQEDLFELGDLFGVLGREVVTFLVVLGNAVELE